MSQATAMAEAKRLQACMQARGVRCSIELQVGRPYSGDDWYTRKYFRMHHHTAARPSQGLTPSLGVVKRGRPDVPGPLANGYGGYDRIFRIITLGLANHPGAGGPFTADGVTMPKDSARISSFGIEWEGGYEPWSAAMIEFMARADLALMDWMKRPITSQLEHKTWAPTRKPDRIGFTRTSAIALSRSWAPRTAPVTPSKPPATSSEESNMAGLTQADKAILTEAFKAALAAERPTEDARQTFDNKHDSQEGAWMAAANAVAQVRAKELMDQGVPIGEVIVQVKDEVWGPLSPLWNS